MKDKDFRNYISLNPDLNTGSFTYVKPTSLTLPERDTVDGGGIVSKDEAVQPATTYIAKAELPGAYDPYDLLNPPVTTYPTTTQPSVTGYTQAEIDAIREKLERAREISEVDYANNEYQGEVIQPEPGVPVKQTVLEQYEQMKPKTEAEPEIQATQAGLFGDFDKSTLLVAGGILAAVVIASLVIK